MNKFHVSQSHSPRKISHRTRNTVGSMPFCRCARIEFIDFLSSIFECSSSFAFFCVASVFSSDASQLYLDNVVIHFCRVAWMFVSSAQKDVKKWRNPIAKQSEDASSSWLHQASCIAQRYSSSCYQATVAKIAGAARCWHSTSSPSIVRTPHDMAGDASYRSEYLAHRRKYGVEHR